MGHTLAMIHTIAGLAPMFGELSKELMPDVETFNIADEAVLRMGLVARRPDAGDVPPRK